MLTNHNLNNVDLKDIKALITEYYQQGKHHQIIALVKLVLNAKNFTGEKLFFYHHASIAAFYCNEPQLGRECNDVLLFCNDNNLRKTAITNGRFYATQLNSCEQIQVPFNPPALIEPKSQYLDQNYRCMNPAIVNMSNINQNIDSCNDKICMNPAIVNMSNINQNTDSSVKTADNFCYWYVQRTSNFDQVKGSSYTCMESDNLVKTRNYLVKLDDKFNIIQQWEIIDTITTIHRPCHVTGIEDIRLYAVAKENGEHDLYISGTTFYNHDYGAPKISWGKLKQPDESHDIVELEYFNPILNPNPKNTEKNWSFAHYKDDEFIVMYKLNPLQVYKFKSDDPDNSWEEVFRQSNKVYGEYMRGSAGPIRYNNGWLAIGHEVIYDTDNNGNITGRTYLHRFIWYNDLVNCKPGDVKISHAFYFSDDFSNFNIEFCLGMTKHHHDDSILLGVGINDRKAKLFRVKYEIIDQMLHDFNNVDLDVCDDEW